MRREPGAACWKNRAFFGNNIPKNWEVKPNEGLSLLPSPLPVLAHQALRLAGGVGVLELVDAERHSLRERQLLVGAVEALLRADRLGAAREDALQRAVDFGVEARERRDALYQPPAQRFVGVDQLARQQQP